MLVTVTIDSELNNAQQSPLSAALTPEQLERLKELISKPSEDAGGASAATAPQTKIRISEEDYTLQVSYDNGENWEKIDLNNLLITTDDGYLMLSELPNRLNDVVYQHQIATTIEQDATLPSRSLKQLVYPKTNKVDAVDYRPTEMEKNGIDYVKELIRVINDYEHYASDRRARMGDFPLERHKSLRKEYLGFIGRIQDLEKMVELMRVKLNTLLPDGNKVDSDVSIIAG